VENTKSKDKAEHEDADYKKVVELLSFCGEGEGNAKQLSKKRIEGKVTVRVVRNYPSAKNGCLLPHQRGNSD